VCGDELEKANPYDHFCISPMNCSKKGCKHCQM
jgi:hypothetical protein